MSKKILVVEDDNALRKTLVRIAKEANEEVVNVGSLEEALKALEGDSFNLVVTDIRLPDGEEGIELLGSVVERFPQTKVIVVTTKAPELGPKAMALGAYDFVDRGQPDGPFYIPVLRNSIGKALRESL
jgi:DNA-binding NtrC family response regulator